MLFAKICSFVFAFLSVIIAILAMIGNIFGIQNLYNWGGPATTGLPTSAMFFCVGISLMILSWNLPDEYTNS